MPWKILQSKDGFFEPSPRCNSGLAVVEAPKNFDHPDGERVQFVIVYGGDVEGIPTDEAYRYNLSDRQWQRTPFRPLQTIENDKVKINDQDRPPAVSRHCMVVRDDGRSVVVFGGVGKGNKIFGEVYAFDAVRFQSKLITTQGESSTGFLSTNSAQCPPLFGHSAIVYSDQLWVFGGRNKARKFNDVWRLSMGLITESWTWRLVKVTGERPPECVRHTAVAVGNNMICVGGDLGSDVFVLKLGGENNFWTVVETTGLELAPLSGHAAIQFNDYMYVCGGVNRSTKKLNKDTLILDTRNMVWSVDESGGRDPEGRVQHAMANIGARVFLFGGEDEAHEKYGDLFELDARLMTWLEMSPDGYKPSARCGHTGAAVGSRMYIVGGAGGGMALADVNYLDTRSNQWTLCTPVATGDESVPELFLAHSMVSYQGVLFLFGGGTAHAEGTRKAGSQLRSFNTATNEWRLLQPTGEVPPPMLGHRAVVWNQRMFVFGGFIEGRGYTSNIYSLSLGSLQWTKHQPGGSVPDGRVGHAFTVFKHYGILFGGSAAKVLDSSVHLLDMRRLMWTSIRCGGSTPAPRHSHAFEIVEVGPDEAQLWVFGGRTGVYGEGEVLNDTYVLRVDANVMRESHWVWSKPEILQKPIQASSSVFVNIDGVLLLHGGDCNGSFLSTLYQLDPQSLLSKEPAKPKAAPKKAPKKKKKVKLVELAATETEPLLQPARLALSGTLFMDYTNFEPAADPNKPSKPTPTARSIMAAAPVGNNAIASGEDADTPKDDKSHPQEPEEAKVVDEDMELLQSEQRDIIQWLQAKGLEKYAEAFNINEIDLFSLILLNDHDLLQLGVKTFGERASFLRMIEVLKDKYERQRVMSLDVSENPLAQKVYVKSAKGAMYQIVGKVNVNHQICIRLLDVQTGRKLVGKTFKREKECSKEAAMRKETTLKCSVGFVDQFRDETFLNVIVLDAGNGTILDLLMSWNPSPQQIRMLFESIVSIVDTLHANNLAMLHVDPSNLTISDSGVVSVFDVGTLFELGAPALIYEAATIDPSTCVRLPPEVAKIAFLASEDNEKEMLMKTRKSMDVWGLGILLADMLGVSECVHGVKFGSMRHGTNGFDPTMILQTIQKFRPGMLRSTITTDNHALDLVRLMLDPSPRRRPTLAQIREHIYMTSVGESQVFNLFNDLVVHLENVKMDLATITKTTNETFAIRAKYGATRVKLYSQEELDALEHEAERQRQLKEDAKRGARVRSRVNTNNNPQSIASPTANPPQSTTIPTGSQQADQA
eukprot:c20488_g1_i1.p1 GENE.c20488_g1_i1~~c20488_g1_i1.p1  ORF type:complete len:1274 (+),score=363.11 c20488_g1_i1:137-3958(+)